MKIKEVEDKGLSMASRVIRNYAREIGADSMDYGMFMKSADLLDKDMLKSLALHIEKSDTAPREYVMKKIADHNPEIFKKMYGDQEGYLSTMKPVKGLEEDAGEPKYYQYTGKDFAIKPSGQSHWADKAELPDSINVKGLMITHYPDMDDYVELVMDHDGPWEIYTDKAITGALEKILGMPTGSINWSEQGQQEKGRAHFDVDSNTGQKIAVSPMFRQTKAEESVSEDAQSDELKRWYRNYSKYSNLNGDKLPFGLYMQLAQTGVPTDGMAADEASQAILDAKLDADTEQDALSGGTVDTGIDFDKVDQPTTNAMKQELADIMGVDAIGEEEITKAMKMLGVTTGMESVQEDTCSIGNYAREIATGKIVRIVDYTDDDEGIYTISYGDGKGETDVLAKDLKFIDPTVHTDIDF